MRFRSWEELPAPMRNQAVRPYYELLYRRRASLAGVRLFDIFLAALLLAGLSPLLLACAAAVRLESPREPVLFRQARVTQYGRVFYICKLRTMRTATGGTQVTAAGDSRITRAGNILRRLRLDELPQLWNILKGDMGFVGARPEVPHFVEHYTGEMNATLLVPAGLTSSASVAFRDEAALLNCANPEQFYIEEILPAKMKQNCEDLRQFGFWRNLGLLFGTAAAVFLPARNKKDRAHTG